MEHVFNIKVHSYHTDWQGILNFGRYSEIISEAIENAYKNLLGKMVPVWGKVTVVTRRYEIDYFKPLRFGDEVKVVLSFSINGEHSLKVEFNIYKGEELCAKGSKILVFIDIEKWIKVPIPQEVKEAIISEK